MKSYKIIDNVLPESELENSKELINTNGVPFYFNKSLNGNHIKENNMFYMTHLLYNWDNNCPSYSTFFDAYRIILDKLEVKSLIRMKINLYPSTSIRETHPQHYDYSYKHKGCIFSLNTCDGATILEDGTEIESVANRALLFNPQKPHSSTSTTNVKARLNVNINYF